MTTEEMQVLVSMMSTMMDEKIDGLRDELKGEVKGLRDELKDEIRETRVLVEHQRHEIQLIAEKVELINEKLSGLDRMESSLRITMQECSRWKLLPILSLRKPNNLFINNIVKGLL